MTDDEYRAEVTRQVTAIAETVQGLSQRNDGLLNLNALFDAIALTMAFHLHEMDEETQDAMMGAFNQQVFDQLDDEDDDLPLAEDGSTLQ